MSQPLAFWNGSLVPVDSVAIGLSDAGFVQGATVAEQVRTFGGRPFRLEEHLNRLARSLEIVGVDPGLSLAQMAEVAEQVVAHNYELNDPRHELGLAIFVTPGAYASFASDGMASPTVCLHTYRLPVERWRQTYLEGQPLVTSSFRQVPAACWPSELKCRSRMHYYLADREAERKQPGARALLLDLEGFVTETAMANIVAYRQDSGLIAPPTTGVLPGISLAMLGELALNLDIAWQETRLTVDDLLAADEVLLTSTPWCLNAVSTLDGQPIGGGKPGPIYARLLNAWGAYVGADLLKQ